jgi:hypothetical protein
LAGAGGSVLAKVGQLLKRDAPPEPAPAPAPRTRKAPAARGSSGHQIATMAAAEQGVLPQPPDFSADTHKPYRKRLVQLQQLAEAGDLAGLEAVEMLPARSTSPKALQRYRDLALVALKARAARKTASGAEAPAEGSPETPTA